MGIPHSRLYLDVLAYHTMGVSKYRELGLSYPLEGVEPMDKQKAVKAKEIILSGIREARAALRSAAQQS